MTSFLYESECIISVFVHVLPLAHTALPQNNDYLLTLAVKEKADKKGAPPVILATPAFLAEKPPIRSHKCKSAV